MIKEMLCAALLLVPTIALAQQTTNSGQNTTAQDGPWRLQRDSNNTNAGTEIWLFNTQTGAVYFCRAPIIGSVKCEKAEFDKPPQ